MATSQTATAPDLKEFVLETARMLTSMLDEVHPLVKAHSIRVANNCANFCETHKLLSPPKVERIYLAALLHDVGLVACAPEALQALAGGENGAAMQIRRHPIIGERILSSLSPLNDILPIVRHHHERFDGQGYPDGKKAAEIPLESRIIALFNHLDNLLYPITAAGQALTVGDALNDISVKSGQHFDPSLMDRFLEFAEATGAESDDFMLQKEMGTLRKVFTDILQQFSAGKIAPPVVPKVVLDLQKEIKRESSNASDLAAVIERDPVISLRLISIANSPAYRGVQEILTIRNALPRLGLKETMNIVFGIANKNLYTTGRAQFKILMDKLWVHSLATAYASKLLAQKLAMEDPDSLFLMGLIHDVGKALLLKAFSEQEAAKSYNIDAIVANINEAHLSVGAMLVKRWGLSQQVINTLLHHEDGKYGQGTAKEVLVVHLANVLSRTLNLSLYNEPDADLANVPAAQLLGLDSATLQALGAEVKQIVSEVAHLF